MSVAAEIGQHLFGSAEWGLGVDNPVCVPERVETTGEDLGIGEVREFAEEAQIACIEGILQVSQLRVTTATAIDQCLITRIPKAAMIATLHDEPEFSELFMADLLSWNSRIEEDLIDQLFNSSEKRLARTLLLLANFGKEATVEPIIAKFSQETLAEMIGTTRSRVSFFMNKFRKLGYIEYNGKLEIRNSQLNVVLYDKPEIRKRDASEEPR